MTDAGDVSTTRAVYDATAGAYVETIGTELNPAFEGPIERALLHAFVELVGTAARPVADLGCGPGRVAAFLARRGVAAVGLDLSPGMVAAGRKAHDDLPLGAADLRRLPLPDRSLDGAVCWYSVIHTPAGEGAGFDVCSTTVREPMLPSESDRQAFVLAFVR